MKKITVFSIILAVLAGIAASLLFGLNPSKYILEYAIYGENSLYTISQYNHGLYLKHSDKNGIISSHRLKYQHGTYCGLTANNDRLYTLCLIGTEYVVDEYEIDGSYMKELLRIPETEYGVYSSTLCQYYEANSNSTAKMLTDVIFIAGNEIYIYPIFMDSVQPMIHYSTKHDANIVWAQRTAGGLYFLDQNGELFTIDDNSRVYHLEFENECIPYAPSASYFSIFMTNLSNLSLSQSYAYFYEEDGQTQFYFNDNPSFLEADSEIYEGVTFSELRDTKNFMDSNLNDTIAGKKKQENAWGNIYGFSTFSSHSVEFPEPGFEIHKCILVFGICAAVVFTASELICILILRLLSARKVIIKQIMLILAVIASLSGLVHWFLQNRMTDLVYSYISSILSNTLDYIELTIDGDYFRDNGLTQEQRDICCSYENRSVKRIDNQSDTINNLIRAKCYISFVEIARLEDGEYKYEFYSNQKPGALVSYFIEDNRLEKFTNINDNTDILDNSYELGMNWFEAVRAITDSSGKQVGFIQIGSPTNNIDKQNETIVNMMTLLTLLLIAIISALFIVIMAGLLRPLKKLKKAVSEVADGKIGTTLAISSNDELQDVAASFSNMSRQLAKYFNSINKISKAYEKYLPKDFFRLMGRDSVLEIDPGDHSTIELTYLFIEINHQSLHLTEEDDFNTLNSIYIIVSDVLSTTNGTIQSFTDRMITCIFSGGAAIAAEAALTVQEKLRSRTDINGRITVSIQYSRSVIGVIGGGEAMKTITVSSALKLQAYLSKIIERFCLTFVVTGEVLSELNEAGLNITARRLGTINQLLGKETSFDIMLYEVIDGCPDEEKKLRQSTLKSYNSALEAAERSDFTEARAHLISVLRENRNDIIARFMLENISGESGGSNDERTKDRLEISN